MRETQGRGNARAAYALAFGQPARLGRGPRGRGPTPATPLRGRPALRGRAVRARRWRVRRTHHGRARGTDVGPAVGPRAAAEAPAPGRVGDERAHPLHDLRRREPGADRDLGGERRRLLLADLVDPG